MAHAEDMVLMNLSRKEAKALLDHLENRDRDEGSELDGLLVKIFNALDDVFPEER